MQHSAPNEYEKFPHTPHLAWLGKNKPRADKVLSDDERLHFLSETIVVEEKIDGSNLGISIDEHQTIRIQNRNNFLSSFDFKGQFKPLHSWIEMHRIELTAYLDKHLIIFGEWCYAVHTVEYSRLPDWFLGFDVYDKKNGRFWSSKHRDNLFRLLKIRSVPTIATGTFDLKQLIAMMGVSKLSESKCEGLYLRQEGDDFLNRRAKLVNSDFVQSISVHWRNRTLRTNQLAHQFQAYV